MQHPAYLLAVCLLRPRCISSFLIKAVVTPEWGGPSPLNSTKERHLENQRLLRSWICRLKGRGHIFCSTARTTFRLFLALHHFPTHRAYPVQSHLSDQVGTTDDPNQPTLI